MAEIKIIDSANNYKDVSNDFLPKIKSISINESLKGEADSINIVMSNNENSKYFWENSFFEDREISLKIEVDGVNFGVFNFDEIDFDYSESETIINMKGLSAPVTTGASVYQQIRKVFALDSLERILTQLAKLANLELVYFFDEFKLKLQLQNEFLFNSFSRLAEKYGAITKIFRDSIDGKYKILFFGIKDIAENAAILKQSEIAKTLGRGAGFIKIDKNNIDKRVSSINFRILTQRKELKVVFYDPMSKRKYEKVSQNKSKLIIADSRKDFNIEKVTSKQEADIVARKVELEPAIVGEMYSRWNPDLISGNIIEFKNYKTFSGYYLIMESSHGFSEYDESSCTFERLPDSYFDKYLKALN